MKISIAKEALKQALDACGKAVNSKAASEICRCVRIEAETGKLRISATNLEEWASIALPGAEIETEGAGIANLAELGLFLKDLDLKGEVKIESTCSLIKVSGVIAGNPVCRELKARSLGDWPVFPSRPSKLSMAPAAFLDAIRKAGPSTSSKDFRRALACVYVGEGAAVATDGHCLVSLPCPSPFEKAFLARPSKLLESGCLRGECRVGVAIPESGQGGLLTVETESLSWTVELSDAEYPNYRQVIPSETALAARVHFDSKGAAELLRAIPTLKSKEGALALRCSPEGVLAGGSCELACFKTDARFSGAEPLDIELSASSVARALELELYELRMADAFSPVLFKDGKGALMASMPLRQKSASKATTQTKEGTDMNKQETHSIETAQQTSATMQPQGLSVVKQQGIQTDPFDDLLKSAEETKATARANYEAASQFARKLRDVQTSIKRKEREQKSTRELIEKLKTASGF